MDRRSNYIYVLRLDFDLRSMNNLHIKLSIRSFTSLRSSLLQNWNTFSIKLLNGQLKVRQELLSTKGRPNKHILRTQPSAKGICRMHFQHLQYLAKQLRQNVKHNDLPIVSAYCHQFYTMFMNEVSLDCISMTAQSSILCQMHTWTK